MHYIVCGPCAQPDIPVGRWTRTSIAYDVQRDKCVILKDSWRISLEDIMPEGDVYKMLHKGNVPNIPCCSMSGDIGDDDFHCSWTDKFVGKFVQHVLAPQLIPHRHYRLVLDMISQELQGFRHSWEMVTAVHAAVNGKLTNVAIFTMDSNYSSSLCCLPNWHSPPQLEPWQYNDHRPTGTQHQTWFAHRLGSMQSHQTSVKIWYRTLVYTHSKYNI